MTLRSPPQRDTQLHMLLRVPAFRKFFHGLSAKCSQVGRLAAGDQAFIDDNFLIDPRAARVLNVCLQARPRGDGPAFQQSASTSIHGPWQIAATGLPCLKKSRTKSTAVSF